MLHSPLFYYYFLSLFHSFIFFFFLLYNFFNKELITRLNFEVFSLDSLWTLDYILAPLPPLGIGLSLAVGAVGGAHWALM